MAGRLYEVTYPDGGTQTVINLASFCQAHDLNKSHMSAVAAGRRSHHKGYMVKILDANGNSPLELRTDERNEKILKACERITSVSLSEVTQNQKDTLVATLFAIKLVYKDLE